MPPRSAAPPMQRNVFIVLRHLAVIAAAVALVSGSGLAVAQAAAPLVGPASAHGAAPADGNSCTTRFVCAWTAPNFVGTVWGVAGTPGVCYEITNPSWSVSNQTGFTTVFYPRAGCAGNSSLIVSSGVSLAKTPFLVLSVSVLNPQ
jgi:Peptidase inhibitor family I36